MSQTVVFIFFQDIQEQIEKQMTKIQQKSQMFSKAFGQLSNLDYEEVKKLKSIHDKLAGNTNLVEGFKQSGINFKKSNIDLQAIQIDTFQSLKIQIRQKILKQLRWKINKMLAIRLIMSSEIHLFVMKKLKIIKKIKVEY